MKKNYFYYVFFSFLTHHIQRIMRILVRHVKMVVFENEFCLPTKSNTTNTNLGKLSQTIKFDLRRTLFFILAIIKVQQTSIIPFRPFFFLPLFLELTSSS
jgi:hypothetical protein